LALASKNLTLLVRRRCHHERVSAVNADGAGTAMKAISGDAFVESSPASAIAAAHDRCWTHS